MYFLASCPKDADWYKKTENWLTIPRAVKKTNTASKSAHFGKWRIATAPKDVGFDYLDAMPSKSGGDGFKILVPQLNKVNKTRKPPGISSLTPDYPVTRDEQYRYVSLSNEQQELFDHTSDSEKWTNIA
jgi:hypothetical protein